MAYLCQNLQKQRYTIFIMMKTLFVVGREGNYARNDVLYRAFSKFSQVDRVATISRPKSLILNSILMAAKAAAKLRNQSYDLVFIGFYGYLILHLISPLVKKPVLFDAFVSNFDTLCNDRKIFSKDSILGKGAFWLDKSALQLSATVLLDTYSHAVFFSKTFNLPLSNFQVLPVGCNDEIFYPMAKKISSQNTQVLYYSSFLPLHGSEVIVRAAALLKGKPIRFKLIGDGPDLANVKQIAKSLGLDNIVFAPPVSPRRLAIEIAESDICLGGHFGKSDKAKRVIPGKIYQMLAGGRPIIASNYPGNRELLSHGDTAFLIEKPLPELLADAIDLLHSDSALRFKLGERARILYESQCSEAVIGQKLVEIVNETLFFRS